MFPWVRQSLQRITNWAPAGDPSITVNSAYTSINDYSSNIMVTAGSISTGSVVSKLHLQHFNYGSSRYEKLIITGNLNNLLWTKRLDPLEWKFYQCYRLALQIVIHRTKRYKWAWYPAGKLFLPSLLLLLGLVLGQGANLDTLKLNCNHHVQVSVPVSNFRLLRIFHQIWWWN